MSFKAPSRASAQKPHTAPPKPKKRASEVGKAVSGGVKVRRFEPACSCDFSASYLNGLGYSVTPGQTGWFFVTGPAGGRPRKMDRRRYIELVDAERKKAGLEPIIRSTDDRC